MREEGGVILERGTGETTTGDGEAEGGGEAERGGGVDHHRQPGIETDHQRGIGHRHIDQRPHPCTSKAF